MLFLKNSFHILKRLFLKTGHLIHLVWFVTGKCNLLCEHCFYHNKIGRTKDELSIAEIEKVINHLPKLLSVSLTGGEPFLRDDLAEIIYILHKKNVTNNIIIYSNGYFTDKIITSLKNILYHCKNFKFFMGISLDGFKKQHDSYRGKNGVYDNAVKTIKSLKDLQKKYTNLNIGVCTTLHQANQGYINEFRQQVYNDFNIYPGITIIRGDVKTAKLNSVKPEIYKKVINTIINENKINNKSLFQTIINTRIKLGYKLAYDIYTHNKRDYACYAGNLMGVIYENGNVFPCEMLPDRFIGNLRDFDYDIKSLWQNENAREIRKYIKTRKCYCTYECQYTCNTCFNPIFLPYFCKDIFMKGF